MSYVNDLVPAPKDSPILFEFVFTPGIGSMICAPLNDMKNSASADIIGVDFLFFFVSKMYVSASVFSSKCSYRSQRIWEI